MLESWYFVSFYWIGITIMLNIFTAVVIDVYKDGEEKIESSENGGETFTSNGDHNATYGGVSGGDNLSSGVGVGSALSPVEKAARPRFDAAADGNGAAIRLYVLSAFAARRADTNGEFTSQSVCVWDVRMLHDAADQMLGICLLDTLHARLRAAGAYFIDGASIRAQRSDKDDIDDDNNDDDKTEGDDNDGKVLTAIHIGRTAPPFVADVRRRTVRALPSPRTVSQVRRRRYIVSSAERIEMSRHRKRHLQQQVDLLEEKMTSMLRASLQTPR
jgi:hypothetical protein